MGSFKYEDMVKNTHASQGRRRNVLRYDPQIAVPAPGALRTKMRKEWSSLSLQELRQMNTSKIKDKQFNDCLKLVRPLLILADILGLLQKRNFQEKAAIIPPELADVMDLDGLEDILEELIHAKTPPITVEAKGTDLPATPFPGEKAIPLLIKDVTPLADKKAEPARKNSKESVIPPKKEKTRGPAVASTGASSSSSSSSSATAPLPVNSDAFDEITQLTKSRLILKKLEQMGFFEKRQTGSHIIMQSHIGGSVVVPNNSNIPRGTTQSIAKQAQHALIPKNESLQM